MKFGKNDLVSNFKNLIHFLLCENIYIVLQNINIIIIIFDC